MHFLVWIIIAFILGISEIVTAGFFMLFFAFGAAITAIVAMFVPNLLTQLIVFLVSSVLLLMYARPFVTKAFKVSDKPSKDSNVATLMGEDVLVTENVDRYGGRVKLLHSGEIWTAYLEVSEECDTLSAGQEGIVSAVDGAKLVIKPKLKAEKAS